MSGVLHRLDSEWRRLAHSSQGRRALGRWQALYPALAGLRDLDELLARRRDDPDTAQGVLAALAALAPHDDLAARVLLQTLVPGLVRLSVTAGNGDRGALDEMISLAWERIRTYPTTRQGGVAANVLLDVRKRYRQHHKINTPRKRHQRGWRFDPIAGDSDDAIAERIATVPSAEDTAVDRAIFDQLSTAACEGVISEPARRLIIRTRILDETVSEVAARTGISRNTLASWRFRAERRLREWQLAG